MSIKNTLENVSAISLGGFYCGTPLRWYYHRICLKYPYKMPKISFNVKIPKIPYNGLPEKLVSTNIIFILQEGICRICDLYMMWDSNFQKLNFQSQV